MTVKEIMQRKVATCRSDDHAGVAAAIMHDRTCGFVPVVDPHGVVVGVLTDRDLSLVVGRARQPAERVAVTEIMSKPVFSCFPEENIKVVLATMAKHQVRRLTVIDKQGQLQGVLSMDDIVLAPKQRDAATAEEIVGAQRLIAARRGAVIGA